MLVRPSLTIPGSSRSQKPSSPSAHPTASTPANPRPTGKKFTLRQRLRYRFDNAVGRGVTPLIAIIVVTLLVIALVVGFIEFLIPGMHVSHFESWTDGFWYSMTRLVDQGTFVDDMGARTRVVSFILTLIGIVSLVTIIGLVSTSIQRRIESLRNGLSPVVETGHTLILGWSPLVPSVVREILEAEPHCPTIVILANTSIDEMEPLLRDLPTTRKNQIVLRSGAPWDPPELARVNAAGARASIVVSDGRDGADARVAKTTLGLAALTGTHEAPLIVEVGDRRVATALKMALEDQVRLVVPFEVGARMLSSVARHPELNEVLVELLDGVDCSFMTDPAGDLAGSSYGEALERMSTGCLIGVVTPSVHGALGTVALNPPMDHMIGTGDQLVIARETRDDPPTPLPPVTWDGAWARRPDHAATRVEHTLIIGWSRFGPVVASLLDQQVAPGSTLDVLIDPDLVDPEAITKLRLANLRVRVLAADSLDVARVRTVVGVAYFDQILVLCYREALEPDDAEARALMTVVAAKRAMGNPECNLVCEMMHVRDTALAKAAQPDAVVISDLTTALSLAHLARNPYISGIYADLFGATSTSLRVRPWTDYTDDPNARFDSVVVAARAHGESAVGWVCAGLDGQPGYLLGGVRVAPERAEQASFGPGDSIIVVG